MQSRFGELIRTAVLSVLVICAALAAQAEPVLQMTTNLIWKRQDDWFGGFSGMEIENNGTQVTLLTDRRNIVFGEIVREKGQLRRIIIKKHLPIRHANNKIVRKRFADTEGLAIGADGATYVSFEGATRVTRLFPDTGRTQRLPDHPDFARMETNKGLEALAIAPNGTLYTLQERTPSHRKTVPLYAFDGTKWALAHLIPRVGPFLSVGADFDRQGRFYLLERALTPLGFRSRIRRFDLTTETLSPETLMTSSAGRFDNMEALSVWEDTAGRIRLTLISDDNFRSIQRTQIVEYILTE